MAIVKVEAYECDRCGHGPWLPRKLVMPKICPNCKSPYWNKKRKKKSSD